MAPLLLELRHSSFLTDPNSTNLIVLQTLVVRCQCTVEDAPGELLISRGFGNRVPLMESNGRPVP